MANEIGDIFRAVAQRRQPKRHDVEAIVKVFAEKALIDQVLQVFVGGRDDAHVGADRRPSAHCRILTLLQHAQEARLRVHRHIADFVEEERTAFRLFEAAGRTVLRAGERALLVTEKFRLDEVARDGCHVDGDERPIAALAVIVKRAGHKFLAGAALAGDHQRQIRLHETGEHAVDFLHGGRATDQWHAVLLVILQLRRLLLRLGERPLDDGEQFGEVEGLRQIVVSTLFGCLDGRHERVLRAHDKNRKLRPCLLDAWQQVEGVLIRHDHVGDDDITLAARHPAPERGSIGGDADIVAGARKRLVEDGADGGVVVGDEDRGAGHGLILPVRHCARCRPYRWKRASERGTLCGWSGCHIRRCRHERQ